MISHSLSVDPRSPQYQVARNLAERWERDEDNDRETGAYRLREDPNGYFIVTVDEEAGEIVAEHRYGGLLVKQYRGDRAVRIERQIIGDMAVMAAIKQDQQLALGLRNRKMLEIVIEFSISDVRHELRECLLGAISLKVGDMPLSCIPDVLRRIMIWRIGREIDRRDTF